MVFVNANLLLGENIDLILREQSKAWDGIKDVSDLKAVVAGTEPKKRDSSSVILQNEKRVREKLLDIYKDLIRHDGGDIFEKTGLYDKTQKIGVINEEIENGRLLQRTIESDGNEKRGHEVIEIADSPPPLSNKKPKGQDPKPALKKVSIPIDIRTLKQNEAVLELLPSSQYKGIIEYDASKAQSNGTKSTSTKSAIKKVSPSIEREPTPPRAPSPDHQTYEAQRIAELREKVGFAPKVRPSSEQMTEKASSGPTTIRTHMYLTTNRKHRINEMKERVRFTQTTAASFASQINETQRINELRNHQMGVRPSDRSSSDQLIPTKAKPVIKREPEPDIVSATPDPESDDSSDFDFDIDSVFSRAIARGKKRKAPLASNGTLRLALARKDQSRDEEIDDWQPEEV